MTRFVLVLLLALGQAAVRPGPLQAQETGLGERLAMLIASYPEVLSHVDGNRLILKDGGPAIVIDDGRAKSHAEALADADVEDMLHQLYPHGPCETRSAVNFDPGRIRSQDLMLRLYGETRKKVAGRLTTIDWFGTRLKVTTAFGVDKALIAVREELESLPEKLRRPALKSAGTFNWRTIAGTDRLSVHSFGAAIDLDTAYADYWRWAGGKPGNVLVHENRMPLEVVAIFERHGFIWGGRWYHYDTMHFEYRPELIAISRAAGADACVSGKQ